MASAAIVEAPAAAVALRMAHVYRYCLDDRIGGVERHIDDLAEGAARRGARVHLVVSQADAWGWRATVGVRDQVEIHRLPRLPEVWSGTFSPGLDAAVRGLDADLLHVHWPHPAALACSTRGRRLVVTYHNDVVRQKVVMPLLDPILHRFLERADRIIASSEEMVQSSPVLARHRARCRVVPHGIRLDAFRDAPGADRLRARFGSRVGLFVGRLVGFKGVEDLLDAWAGIDGHLVIVGDGPRRASLEKRAAHPDLAGRVTFAGEIREGLADFYHAADLLVLPSRTRVESFGLVQAEAHACGIPVVSTRVGTGVEAVNLDGVTGRTVAPRDVPALRAAIRGLLDDPVRRAEMGAAARERAWRLYDSERMVEGTLAVYSEAR